MLHVGRDHLGRRLREIGVQQRRADGLCEVVRAVEFDAEGRLREGPGAERLVELVA